MKGIGFLFLTVLLAAGCAPDDKDDESPPVYDNTTKAGIEAYIADHWQEYYGYSAKPTKYIALSFDDGPNSQVTQNLLGKLALTKVKATFFLIGGNIRSNKALAKAIFDAGHEIGNHSDGYAELDTASNDAIRTSLNAANDEIMLITGTYPVLFRAPGVKYNAALYTVCQSMGLALIDVSVWSNDWQSISKEQTVTNVLANPKDGDIINCHELANTVAAVEDIVIGLREKGFWIMSVGELAIVKGVTLVAGTRYYSIN